jgi:hypothetical protein
VFDFEKAVWVAIRQVMPLVNMKDYGFLLCQALYKNLKEIGMLSQYRLCKKTREICRQLLSLNLLPSERIEKLFRAIVAEVEKLEENAIQKRFCAYVDRNLISSTIWPPSTWSMFMQHRRTNNNAKRNSKILYVKVKIVQNLTILNITNLGYHSHLKDQIASNNPNLIKFLLSLDIGSRKNRHDLQITVTGTVNAENKSRHKIP